MPEYVVDKRQVMTSTLATAVGVAAWRSTVRAAEAKSSAAGNAGATPNEIGVTHGSVSSLDGTSIGYTSFGKGSPLVVCHGAYTVADDWARFGLELCKTRRVHI
jgi:hypothetical protein